MRASRVALLWLVAGILPSGAALAQEPIKVPPSSPVVSVHRPSAVAVHVQQAPVVDGRVDSDGAWNGVAPVSDFWQERPDEGRPASEKTEVRLAFTDDTLYIGVIC